MAREVIWNKTALEGFVQALEWLSKNSFSQTEKVESSILEKIDKISITPEIYPPDKFKKNNDGSYRAFESNHYRLSYRFTEAQIRILRFKHVKQEPKEY